MKPRIQGVLTQSKPGSSASAFGLRLAFTPGPARSGRDWLLRWLPRPGQAPGQAEHPAAIRRDAQTAKKSGLGAGPGHPEPRRERRDTLGPSVTIMPVDSYSTLGRSCEPAFKWIPDPGQARVRARAARQRGSAAASDARG